MGLFKNKKKKEPKVEQVFESKEEKLDAEEQTKNDLEDFLGVEETPDDNLTESQRAKKEKLDSVKSKISKILQSSNIEIIDENFDDEYEKDAGGIDGKSEQDYDELKSLFGEGDKKKKQEVTLTIDDFDYAYIGQYLEEYDLSRMKNIKRVKLIRKKSPKLRKALISFSLVLVLALGGVLGYFLLRETPVYLKSVTLNQSERTYYLNDIFDYTGLYFIAEYSDGRKENIDLTYQYFNDNKTTKVEKSGEDKTDLKFTLLGTANLFFTYNGFDTEYIVNVVKKESCGFSVLYTKDVFNKNQGDFITADMLQIIVDYKSYGKEFVGLSDDYVLLVDGVVCTLTTDGYKVNANITPTSIIEIRTRSTVKVDDGDPAILIAELDRDLTFVVAEREN